MDVQKSGAKIKKNVRLQQYPFLNDHFFFLILIKKISGNSGNYYFSETKNMKTEIKNSVNYKK